MSDLDRSSIFVLTCECEPVAVLPVNKAFWLETEAWASVPHDDYHCLTCYAKYGIAEYRLVKP